MTSILDNELVRRYFAPDVYSEKWDVGTEAMVSLRVLSAMQEPIRKGERYLLIDSEVIGIKTADSNSLEHGKHLGALRLPQRFQPPSDKKECDHQATETRCTKCGELRGHTTDWIDAKGFTPQPPPTQPPCPSLSPCKPPHAVYEFCDQCRWSTPNKFDEAVKRSFEEDRIIEPGTVFEKPVDPGKCKHPAYWTCGPECKPVEKCGCDIVCLGHDHSKCGCKCKCHAPDPAIEAKIDAIVELLINNRCDKRSSLAKELRELVALARRSDR